MSEISQGNAEIAKNFAVKTLPDSEVELMGDVPYEAVAPYREQALKHMAEHMDLPGFRPGHVPPDMIVKKVGEVAVLEEAVELFIQDFYLSLLETHNIDAVGRPNITITKLAPSNPIGLVIRAAVYPVITLPKNWKTVGENIPLEATLPATEDEVNQTIESLRQSRAKREEGKEPVLPEVNDEFAKTLGAFENVDALKEQIKKGITEEKERAARDTRRGKIIDALIEKLDLAVPSIFVESELEKIIAQLKEDISRFGLTYEAYLKQVNKTEEAVREDFKAQALKRAKLQLTLNKIAEEEKVVADPEMVESEMQHAIAHFPDAKPELLKIHIETVLRNEKVLQLLEAGK
jgi:FKBP-type peptidyl-prolyl cis-trans isomerase (trigger factor)